MQINMINYALKYTIYDVRINDSLSEIMKQFQFEA